METERLFGALRVEDRAGRAIPWADAVRAVFAGECREAFTAQLVQVAPEDFAHQKVLGRRPDDVVCKGAE